MVYALFCCIHFKDGMLGHILMHAAHTHSHAGAHKHALTHTNARMQAHTHTLNTHYAHSNTAEHLHLEQ